MDQQKKCVSCEKAITDAEIETDKGSVCLDCFQKMPPEEEQREGREERKDEKIPFTGECVRCGTALDPASNIEAPDKNGYVCMDCFIFFAELENEKQYNSLTHPNFLSFLMFNLYREGTEAEGGLSARYINMQKGDPTQARILSLESNQEYRPVAIPEFFSSVIPLSEYQWLITGGCVKTPNGFVPSSMFLGVAVHKHSHFFSFGSLNNMSTSRFAHTSVIVNNYLYVLGGLQTVVKDKTYCWLDSCEKFNLNDLRKNLDIVLATGDKTFLSTKNWEPAEKMHHPRANFSAFVHEGKIYAFGGFSGANTVENSIERYDCAQNKWEVLDFKEKLQKINYSFLASSLLIPYENEVFIFGGSDGKKASNQAIKINVEKLELEALKPLNQARAGAHGFSSVKKIYLFGGEEPSKTDKTPLKVEILDLEKRQEGFKAYEVPEHIHENSGILGNGFIGDYGFFISSYKF